MEGPNSDHNIGSYIQSHEISYEDRSKEWSNLYLDNLRELALSYWMGSEYDIALIKLEIDPDTSEPVTKVFHVFDSLTHMALIGVMPCPATSHYVPLIIRSLCLSC